MNYPIEATGTNIEIKTFNQNLINKFSEYTDVKQTTLKGYMNCLKQFSRWIIANNIKTPTRQDIKDYKTFLDEQGYTAGTKAQYLRAVKQFFKWTNSEGYYPNITDNVKGAKVKQDNTKKEAFTESDIKTILESIDTTTETGKRDYLIIILSVTCGFRIIEIQRANVGDIQTIKGQKVLYIQGKGHDEKDDYKKLVPQICKLIDEYLSLRETHKKNDPLFRSVGNRNSGGRLTEPSISRIIKQRFKRAGYDCEKLTAHSLRHTSNTLLFKSGADLYTVQQHARHTDPKTTEIYIHALDKEITQSEQRIFNQIFNPENKNVRDKINDVLDQLSEESQAKALEILNKMLEKDKLKAI